MIAEISVEELKRKIDTEEDFILLDVRQIDEHQFVNIGGKVIPLGELPGRIREIDRTKEIVVYCRSGVRSANAAQLLMQHGFDRVKNLQGGIRAWSERIDSSKPKY